MSSLVICGNEVKTTGGASQFQSAYSFNNHLKQPLRIPPNSEVAVQSLKIVKEGSITLTPATKWYQFYGEKLSDTKTQAETTSAPIPVSFGLTENKSVRTSELARELKDAVNKGVANPETFGFNEVSQIEDAQGDFGGFRFNFKSRSSGSGVDVKPTKWVNSYAEADGYLVYNSAGQTLTGGKQDSPYNVAIGTDNPIALNQGEFIVDLSNANSTNWAVGLTRSRATGKNPDYFNPDDSEIFQTTNIFCDFLVGGFQTSGAGGTQRKIRVFQAVYDTTSGEFDEEKPISMREVDYTSGSGAFSTLYDWSLNNDSYSKVKISIENENVKVELYTDKGGSSWDLLVSPNSPSKLNKFKPVADTCRALYPLAYVQKNNKSLAIEKFSGRAVGMTYGKSDWWGYLSAKDLDNKYGLEVDTRLYNNMGDTAETHTYKGLNASGFLDYDFVMIVDTDPDDRYKDTKDARASSILGFGGKSVLDTYDATNSFGGGYYDSTSIPTLKSSSSIFVRLNNFNITTYNANVSAFSNIIYSAPRFSTGTDKNVGSLFFECPERTYVALNNTSEIVVNNFNIDLVNENETLAKDLSGKSVCILHFRKAPKV
jgi:hypothetical protein